MVDYLAVEQADPEVLAAIGRGPARPAPSRPGSRSPAASWPSFRRWSAAIPRPTGSTSWARPSASSELDRVVTGERISAGRRADRGCRRAALHSNGFTLARRALLERGGLSLDDSPSELGRRSPTSCSSRRRSTCARSWTCSARDWTSAGSPTSPATGCSISCRLNAGDRLRDRRAPARTARVRADRGARRRRRRPRCTRSSTWAPASCA